MTELLPAGNHAYANWGRWVVHCPRLFCFSAMQVYPGQAATACADCGEPIPDLIWPADPEGIETILLLRLDVRTRNWHPGESLDELLIENVAHGIMPPAGPGPLMATVDGVLTGGAVGLLLRSDTRRHQIEGALHGLDDAAHRGQ